MDKISITVIGDPQALKRPRFHNIKSKATGKSFVNTYDPSAKDKKNFLYDAISDNRPERPIEGAINLNIVFYISRPKNHYGTGKNSSKLKDWAPTWHTKRPDVDNYIKFILDAFNETYWKDDSQVCKITAIKVYTDMQPRTEIEITEI